MNSIYVFLCFLSLGLLNFINYWFKNRLYRSVVFKEEEDVNQATYLALKLVTGHLYIKKL